MAELIVGVVHAIDSERRVITVGHTELALPPYIVLYGIAAGDPIRATIARPDGPPRVLWIDRDRG